VSPRGRPEAKIIAVSLALIHEKRVFVKSGFFYESELRQFNYGSLTWRYYLLMYERGYDCAWSEPSYTADNVAGFVNL